MFVSIKTRILFILLVADFIYEFLDIIFVSDPHCFGRTSKERLYFLNYYTIYVKMFILVGHIPMWAIYFISMLCCPLICSFFTFWFHIQSVMACEMDV